MKKRMRDATRAQRELEKRMFHLKTLYDAGREIGCLLDTQAIVRTLLMTVVGTFGAERGLVVVVEAHDKRVEALAALGFDEPEEALAPAVASVLLESAPEPGAAPLLTPAACGPRLPSLGVHAWVPFEVNATLRGGIGLGEKLTGEPYTVDDAELLVTLANQAAMAVQNAAAHQQVVRYAEELQASLRRIQILESMKANLAKFVPKTVQALIEESPEAPSLEKREADVSVLFADITEYSTLSAQLDLDRVNQLVEVYFGAFLDEIVKYGGDVNETVGDGLMVIFRDPDPARHAQAAVLAALAIQRRTQEINETLDGHSRPITMHVGVNSGIASVGVTKIEGVAGTRWTYTASGPTTNIAARLAALATGTVIVSEETRRRLDPAFEVEDLGLQRLKNIPVAMRVCRVVAAPAGGLDVASQERRQHPRRPVAWRVRLRIGDDTLECKAADASLYGLCLVDVPAGAVAPGHVCELEILDSADGTLIRESRVHHVSERGVGIEVKQPLPPR
jgi:class 3 adenylate cyclase